MAVDRQADGKRPPSVPDDEVLLHRVPPTRPDFVTIKVSGGCERVSSVTCCPRRKEDGTYEYGLSVSRLSVTAPSEVLAALKRAERPKDPSGWRVSAWTAAAIRAVGSDLPPGRQELPLEILVDPTEVDPGHCQIVGADGLPCPRQEAVVKRLARVAVLLPAELVERNDRDEVAAFVRSAY